MFFKKKPSAAISVSDALLVVGLGNPGKEYAGNRHNVGFMAVDAIAERYGFSKWNKKFQGLLAEGTIEDKKVFLLKPQTYMNLSGESVAAAMRFYKIPIENIIVIHDEIDFDFGKVKLKKSGGAAGHNGLKSIESHISKDFIRVRFGVGKPAFGDVADYVLSDFSSQEIFDIRKMLNKLSKILFPAVEKFLEMGAKNLVLDLMDNDPKTTVSAKAVKGDSRLRGNDEE